MFRSSEKCAVLVADICGSTRLYESVGDAEAYKLIADSIATLKETISGHDGSVVKTMGDGLLSILPSPDSAFAAAIDMQNRHRNSKVAIRIGVNFGNVVRKRRDVFGDSVNVAAHLVTLARPSETVISGDAIVELSAGNRRQTQLFDKVRLKGKTEPTDCYRVVAGNLDDTMISRPDTQIAARRSTLTLRYGDKEIALEEGGAEMTIGRDAECDLTVEGTLVSRSHATIRPQRGGFYLIDHSTNGTFVRFEGDEPVVLKREALQLHSAGAISLSADIDDPNRIDFRCDFDRG